ncbi:hypothetical protein THASP1DRAFT_25155 [Thamnocephalis sphaerospora]|uniref:Uncharacterized protein n=1 Tax=Thamnocephalis sphaerospora TaxID=78915 RepID=A0A4P9XL34_9FUNG|nr:hypothetical protein THASP1DRAFT_25152 [Thamnocephalis sphaerospora]RKP06550.1 hypothetical protein THASP1DRAFT_25155 [Thamnocephalis sphaerospora]|eukprot:RKP06547.1 hypothetical protein THASP1DRAFT_25152 [Thamnocephalis sphaerospora]
MSDAASESEQQNNVNPEEELRRLVLEQLLNERGSSNPYVVPTHVPVEPEQLHSYRLTRPGASPPTYQARRHAYYSRPQTPKSLYQSPTRRYQSPVHHGGNTATAANWPRNIAARVADSVRTSTPNDAASPDYAATGTTADHWPCAQWGTDWSGCRCCDSVIVILFADGHAKSAEWLTHVNTAAMAAFEEEMTALDKMVDNMHEDDWMFPSADIPL